MKNLSSGFLGILFVFGSCACSAPDRTSDSVCDPNGYLVIEWCKEQLTKDAGSDADAATNSADDSPGLAPTSWSTTCDGRCAPQPSGMSAGGWEKVPIVLYVGPDGPTPLACPEKAPVEKWRLFDELVAPPAACEACTCEASNGECSNPPPKIEIRAGACGQAGAAITPFDGPANWTGTCSSEGGLSAGAMCGNVPCAQAVWASPLDAPTNETCNPTILVPSYTKEHSWKTRAIACQPNTPNGTCGSKTAYCVSEPSPEWLTCVYQKGTYELGDCPNEYNASIHRFFPSEPIDDRGCSPCSCGVPIGSACIGNMRIYGDAACSNEFVNVLLGSMGEGCTNIIPQGRAIGAKRVTDLAYLSGICGSSGGEPTGAATANLGDAVTFCCMKPLPPQKSMPE